VSSPAGFGTEPSRPKGCPLISALRMAPLDTIILLIVNYHAGIGGARVPRAPLLCVRPPVVKVVLWSRGAQLTKLGWSKPHTHSNPTNLALFRHKITLYRFNQGGSCYCRGGQMGAGGWAPRSPLTLTTAPRKSSTATVLRWRRHYCRCFLGDVKCMVVTALCSSSVYSMIVDRSW